MARTRRGLQEINAGSMADIAFLLLIFFLVTTTMDVDTGIARKLPPMPEEEQPPPDILAKNIFQVRVGAGDVMLFEDESGKKVRGSIENLKEAAKMFIDNNGVNPNHSENPDKAIISLVNDRGTSYKMYVQVQNELTAAYNELRNDASLNKFGKRYIDLSKEDKKTIKKMYPQKISEAEPISSGK
jgi:biopolymer transport protein ExbD|tara:strand:+ start:332 stop:886 length:555 start_codon:yes stop_codon:yes gene_type:complete